MEASGAVGGDAGQQGEQGQQQGGGEQQAGPDLGALASQLESLQGGQEELRQFLLSNPWQQGEGGEGDGEPSSELDLSFLNDETALGMEPEQLQQQFSNAVQQQVQQQIAQAVGPIQQAQAEARMEAQARDLVAEFPELGERELAEQVVGVAGQYADAHFPPEVAQALKNSPAFWRAMYMAGRAAESANEEGAESPNAATLEGGGGARAAGGQQVDLGDEILKAGGGGRSVLPFG